MNLELNPEYIKMYMKEIQDTVDEIKKKDDKGKWLKALDDGIWLDSIKVKAGFVQSYIEGKETEHNRDLIELEKDMSIFRNYDEAKDFRGEIDV